jgi:hypothetical protein
MKGDWSNRKAVVQGNPLFCGGRDYEQQGQVGTNSCWRLEVTTKTWVQLPGTMIEKRYGQGFHQINHEDVWIIGTYSAH